jgi:hypothetical protein
LAMRDLIDQFALRLYELNNQLQRRGHESV